MTPFMFGPFVVKFDNHDRSPDFFPPAKVKILRMRAQVVEPLATGDDGIITLYDKNDHQMANGVLVMPAGSPMNWKASPPAPTSNNIVCAGDFFRIRAGKGITPGGEVLVVFDLVNV